MNFIKSFAIAIVLSVIFKYSLSIHAKFIISSFFILVLSQVSSLTLWITTVLFSLITFVFPVTLNFGIPSKAHLLNAAHTTFQESYEFLFMVLSAKSIIIVLITIFLLVLYLKNGLRILKIRQNMCKYRHYRFFAFQITGFHISC